MIVNVCGAQQGDEGKGRIVDNLARRGSIYGGIRAQGANNAGHTIVHEGVTYKLHLIPSTVISGKPGFLGRGMALDLDVLVKEIEGLEKHNIHPGLLIDSRAHVIMPWHIDLDGINEQKMGNRAAGSTGRGVAPVYASKHERTGIRLETYFKNYSAVEDLTDLYAQRVAVERGLNAFSLRKKYSGQIAETREKVENLQNLMGDVTGHVYDLLLKGKTFLGECAQSEMLDVDSPYYPYGSSSSTTTIGIWNGIGISPKPEFIGEVIGVAKAYVTRVGNGPFITEVTGEVADNIRTRGNEYGTTTGRERKIGWLDIPMVKQAVIPSGITGLAITKLDILGGMGEVSIALHYEGGDKIPCEGYIHKKPIYTSMEIWPAFDENRYRKEFENGIARISNVPLRRYLETIQDEVGVPIKMVTFGQDSKAFISYV